MDGDLRERVERAMEERVFPGCVIGLIRAKGSMEMIAAGTLAYDGGENVQEDTIYDVASITKSIPTASLALTFVAEGKLSLSDMVRTYVPELQNDYGATVEDLLRYRVKGTRLSRLQCTTFEEVRTHVFEHGFDLPVRGIGEGGRNVYTNLPAFLLGLIVERVGGEILPALAHRYFFEPLNMRDTTFFPSFAPPSHKATGGRSKASEGETLGNTIAPTEIVDGKEIRGIVHDESARVFSRARQAVGHAGLFSTAPDLLKFCEALLDGRLKTIADGAEMGLGWAIDEPWRKGRYGQKTFSKTGFTGTLIVVDRDRGIGLVVLSNRTYPHRPPDNSAINTFRADIADIVFSSV